MRVVEPQQKLGSQCTHIIHQAALLQKIIQAAQATDAFEFYPGWRVQQLQQSAGRIRGVEASDGEQTREFVADLVIAADGRYSQLRKQAGLSLTPSSTQFDVLWFTLPAPQALLCETVFTVCLQQQRQFAFYPSWDERLHIGWIVEKGQATKMGDRDWIEEFIPALPPALVEHFRQYRSDLAGPRRLDVKVGLAPQWSRPGLLLMGDAAHPMAPNRAQGINMALRDAIAIANHLVPLWQTAWAPAQLDTALSVIQAERQPEIIATQHLQLEEWQKIARLTASPLTYTPFTLLAAALGRFGMTQQAWLWQQRGLRHGITPLTLQV
jgi:2-polyprenyl-6-methoxyphenol hydroxylase-like FAD-dependent oxidoreductase